MNAVKKLSAFAVSLVMCISTVTAKAYSATVITKNITWTMSSNSDRTTHSADFEWNNLVICANGEKTVNFDGTYLKLQGSANKVSFKAAGPCTITLKLKSNNTSTDRYAVVTDSSGNKLGSDITAPMSGENTESVSYSGYGEEITITPKGGGISIKSIGVAYNNINNIKGDIDGDGNVNKYDAALLLRYLTGSEIIKDEVKLSAANGNNDGIIDVRDAGWILNNIYEPTSETTTVQVIDTSDGIEVTDYSELAAALSDSGVKVYVMNDIDMEERIQLKGNQSVIGVPDENGVFPVLNFENMAGRDIVNESSSDSDVGLRINSADNVVKNLVIEKAHDNGIQIKGTGAKGNLIENCIVRYNNDSGIQVTGGACANTLKCVYSYRNCDVFTLGGNADGFAIKLSAGPVSTADTAVIDANKNVCIDCYAWENADDGWDSYDYPEEKQNFTDGSHWTYRIDYTNCMCWSNGSAANCFGYTDYINGLPLDENLPFIMRYKAVYPDKYDDFVTQYNNGTLCSKTSSSDTYYGKLDTIFGTIPTAKGALNASSIASSDYWQGNPNGFKLGSVTTESNSERYMTNCIAFDHGANGFDQNNSAAKIWADSCISFGNKINYHLAKYTAYKWTNVFGWSGASGNNKPAASSGVTIAINDGSAKEDDIRAAALRLINYADSNRVIASNIFSTVF